MLPADFRLAWISTRRTRHAPYVIAANVIGMYLLHEILTLVKLPLDELSTAHLVIVEVPPVFLEGF